MNIKLGHKITDNAGLNRFGYLLSNGLIEPNGYRASLLKNERAHVDGPAENTQKSEEEKNAGYLLSQ